MKNMKRYRSTRPDKALIWTGKVASEQPRFEYLPSDPLYRQQIRDVEHLEVLTLFLEYQRAFCNEATDYVRQRRNTRKIAVLRP